MIHNTLERERESRVSLRRRFRVCVSASAPKNGTPPFETVAFRALRRRIERGATVGERKGSRAAMEYFGREIKKVFKDVGVFTGKVIDYHRTTGYRVQYEDGDSEDLTLKELVCTPRRSRPRLLARRLGLRPSRPP